MEAYFTLESISRKSAPNFDALRRRLLAAVNARLQNGEFTERGLAKILGASQPHMHNVLKGTRTLQWDLADRLIAQLGMKLLDLWTEEELVGDERFGQLRQQETAAPNRAEATSEGLPRRAPRYEIRIRPSQRAAAI
jgi:plasmid maintenance system antidote protein VapI